MLRLITIITCFANIPGIPCVICVGHSEVEEETEVDELAVAGAAAVLAHIVILETFLFRAGTHVKVHVIVWVSIRVTNKARRNS